MSLTNYLDSKGINTDKKKHELIDKEAKKMVIETVYYRSLLYEQNHQCISSPEIRKIASNILKNWPRFDFHQREEIEYLVLNRFGLIDNS